MGLKPPAPNPALQDLAALVGDDAAREIVRLFLSNFPEAMRAIGQGTRQERMRIAHGLRSSALHMGADRLSALVTQIEDKLSQPEATLVPADLAEAIGEFESVAVGLRTYAGS